MSFIKQFYQQKMGCIACYERRPFERLEQEIIPPACTIKSVITPEQLTKMINNVLLIDVRELMEREIFNIGGISIPLSQLNQESIKLNKSADIVVYCKSGIRSKLAAQQLLAEGYKSVRSLDGGIENWMKFKMNESSNM